MVPERKSTFVQLLKEQNDKLQEQCDCWAKRCDELYQDYIAFQYSEECQQCKELSKENTLRRELIHKNKEIRYWQEAYKRLSQNE